MREKKNVTISDIAAAAAVSKTTVSHYLNGNFASMSEATQERIRKVIEVSGYQPNTFARSLKGSRSKLVGLVVADISSPFTSNMVRGLSHVLYDSGYTPVVSDCKDSPDIESRVLDTMLSHNVDGLIVNTSSFLNPKLIRMECGGLPIVLCDRYVKDYHFNYAGVEHRRPAAEAVGHLRQQGFAKVAYFTQPYERNSARISRRNGYLQGMRAHYPEADTAALEYLIDISDWEVTQRAVTDLLAGCGAGEIPAIIACNTMTLLHVISVLQRMKLVIPDEIGICGPDDFGFSASNSWSAIISPQITTFDVNPYELGTVTGGLFLKRMEDPELPKKDIILPSVLTVRGSTLLHRNG